MQNNKIIENAIVHCVQVGAYTNTRTHMCNPPGGKEEEKGVGALTANVELPSSTPKCQHS